MHETFGDRDGERVEQIKRESSLAVISEPAVQNDHSDIESPHLK